MTQTSSPLVGINWTDEDFRAHWSDLDAVLGPPGGSAYALTLPSTGNDVTVAPGSARVAGFLHQVTASEPLTVPAASSLSRTDTITVRYDPAWPVDGNARPCRLVRVAGTPGAGAPTLDLLPPGAEELPLWQITRAPSQTLNQATVQDVRSWFCRRTASVSTAPPPAPAAGDEWIRTDTGHIYGWSGSAWRFLRTVRTQRQKGNLTYHFTNSVAAGTIAFPDPFAATPTVFHMYSTAITNNTPVAVSIHDLTATGFAYVAFSVGPGSYGGLTTGSWYAEVM